MRDEAISRDSCPISPTDSLTGSSPADYVLLLQEAVAGMPSDPERVARARQLSIVFEPVRTIDAGAIGIAILSTQPLTGTRVITLPRERQRRLALATTIRVAGTELFLVNAHFENRVSLWRGLLFSDGARGRQATALLAELPDGPGIAGGDLNTWLGPTEPALKAFAARFPDTPAGTHGTDIPRSTRPGSPVLRCPGRLAGRTAGAAG